MPVAQGPDQSKKEKAGLGCPAAAMIDVRHSYLLPLWSLAAVAAAEAHVVAGLAAGCGRNGQGMRGRNTACLLRVPRAVWRGDVTV